MIPFNFIHCIPLMLSTAMKIKVRLSKKKKKKSPEFSGTISIKIQQKTRKGFFILFFIRIGGSVRENYSVSFLVGQNKKEEIIF